MISLIILIITLAKFCFHRIFSNRAKYPCISRHQPYEIRVSRDAQNICAVAKVGTVLYTEGPLSTMLVHNWITA